MRNEFARLPGWFKMMFAVVMLACVGIICICLVDQPRLETEIAELKTSIETSIQREEKQQAEYDAVAEKLPGAQEELAEIQPVADAARAEADALRATRDSLRDDEAVMQAEKEMLTTGIDNLHNALEVLAEME